jgi:pantothenate kinase
MPTLDDLGSLATGLLGRGRRLVGVAGPPGAGKSTLAASLVDQLGEVAAGVPLDGFHLADVQLARLGLLERKGAPETFDAWGYAALLARLRERPPQTVYAPGFERRLEQPLAAAIAVEHSVEVLVAEGNYLLLDRPEWVAVREQLDEVWYVVADESLRLERLLARHIEFGKSEAAARAWVQRVDEPNGRLVEASRGRADRQVTL